MSESTEEKKQPNDNVVILGKEYMVFKLDVEDYGVDILEVVEIRGWQTVTSIPNSPECVLGVLNLRGAIVPIIDLRIRLGLPVRPYDEQTVVIVLRVKSEEGIRVMGIAVDSVSDVVRARSEEIGQSPDFGTDVDTDFIAGLATTQQGMIRLLKLEALFNLSDQSY